jgi:hypothetical protein
MAPFSWTHFNGRCRTRLLTGLVLMVVGLGFGTWSMARLGEASVQQRIEGPIATFAARLVAPPLFLRGFRPASDRERALFVALVWAQDALFGMTLLALRMIVALTLAGLGLVLLTAGSTEWQVRSEMAATSTASS